MFLSPKHFARIGFSAAALAAAIATLPLDAQTSTALAPLTPAQIESELDPQMAQVLSLYDSIKGVPVANISPEMARQQFSLQDAAKILARGTNVAPSQSPVGAVLDGLTIPGPSGNSIPVRIYTPKGTGPFPVILYFHGGGFVIATIDTYDSSARALSLNANAIVVSVEYRKAPEAPFPAAREDALTSYQWVLNNIAKYNGTPAKVAVAGESAGGNLAIQVALNARDRGLQQPTYQLLVYPVTTANLKQASDILYSSSVLPLNTPLLEYFFGYYADPSESTNPEVAPIWAKLGQLPPTTIIAAQLDPLVGDGQQYAAKLKTAGSPIDYYYVTGVTHEFFGLGAVVDKAKAAEQYGASKIAASFQ